MRLAAKILFLFLLSCAIEATFISVYRAAATGDLKEAIAAHTEDFQNNTIPPADEIDTINDDWVQVARFESTFYKVQFFVDVVMNIIFAWVLIMGGVSAAIAAYMRKLSPNVHVARGLYLAAYTVLITIVTSPIAISSYFIGHLRGTDLITPDLVVFTVVQNTIVGIIFALITYVPFYAIMDYFKRWWWLICGLFMAAFTLATVFLGPILIDPLYIDAQPLANESLERTIENIAAKAQVPLEDVYVSNTYGTTLESNAVVSGMGATKRVILDDTLIQFYTPEEISTIVAHEFGHYVLGHIWRSMALMIVTTIFSFWVLSLALHFMVRRYGKHIHAKEVNTVVLYPLIGTLLSFIGMLTAPVLSYQSRTYEHQADVYAIELTHDPEATATAFKKLAYQSFYDPDPPPILQWWFGTHPTTQERIDFALSQSQK